MNPSDVPLQATFATTRFRHVKIAGMRIFHREAGPSSAPTIVLLHGYPSSSRMYAALIPLLADRYHVIAPDYPGFRQSDASPSVRYAYTFDHLAETKGALLDHLQVERFVFFMQDYGGPVGFRMAVAHPGRVQAMIIQNANAYEEGLGAKWTGIARYWEDPAAHAGKLDAFMSLEGARVRHLGDSPNVDRYDPDCWQDARAYARDLPDAEIHILDGGHFALDEDTDGDARLPGAPAGPTRDVVGRPFPDRPIRWSNFSPARPELFLIRCETGRQT
jgi:hypothetical protein